MSEFFRWIQIFLIYNFLSRDICASEDFDFENFLSNYGYSSYGSGPNALSESVKIYQSSVNLEPTGVIDEKTLKQMKTPRCGVKDNNNFKTGPTYWRKNVITYKVINIPSALGDVSVKREVREAFNEWEKHINLTFNRIQSGQADIVVDFVNSGHQCKAGAFESTTLGHAFYPPVGDIHINKGVSWSIDFTNDKSKKFMRKTMAHEIGHALGLHHSRVKEALMYQYDGIVHRRDNLLHQDDIDGIKSLYRSTVTQDGPSGQCRPLWDNQCRNNDECCNNNCVKGQPNWTFGVCRPVVSKCKSLWDNTCTRDQDCCDGFCYKLSDWSYGVCKPRESGSVGECRPLWDNKCKGHSECCSKNCFKESHWTFGVCNP